MKKKIYLVCFLMYLSILITIIFFSLNYYKKDSIKIVYEKAIPLDENYQDSIEKLSAIPQSTILMHEALYDASQIK